MQHCNLLAGLAVATITVSGTLTYGATTTWTGGASSSVWNENGNWSGNAPANGDTVIIEDQAHQPIYDDNGTPMNFVKLILDESGADLSFAAGSVMTLTGDGNGLALEVATGATLTVSGSASTLEFDVSGGGTATVAGTVDVGTGALFVVSDDLVASGAGKIQMAGTAMIQIAPIEALVNNLDIGVVGAGSIVGQVLNEDTGIFVNLTKVTANGGPLTLAQSTVLFDADLTVGEWIANAGNLIFARQHTSPPLEGAFLLTGNGKLIFDASITTNGIFTCTSGDVEVNNGSEFRYVDGTQQVIDTSCSCGSGQCPS